MNEKFVTRITRGTKEIESAGLIKKERIITSEQGPEISCEREKSIEFLRQ
jgi:glycine C-acetyltransferase